MGRAPLKVNDRIPHTNEKHNRNSKIFEIFLEITTTLSNLLILNSDGYWGDYISSPSQM